MSRIIVCDTGPLLHLSEARAIHLLGLAGKILVPPAVVAEFKRNALKQKLPTWIMIRRLDKPNSGRVSEWVSKELVDLGEAEAISLALQVKSEWLLTDDSLARQFAGSPPSPNRHRLIPPTIGRRQPLGALLRRNKGSIYGYTDYRYPKAHHRKNPCQTGRFIPVGIRCETGS